MPGGPHCRARRSRQRKTATLAVKVAHLLADVVPGSRGVACVTYNNDAVREVTSRLGVLGIRPGRSVFVGTVHSFCLNAVLRPYARLAPEIARPDRTVLAGHRRADLVAAALTREGSNDRVSWFEPRLQSIRRAQALAESVERFDPLDVRVAARYSALLAECNAVDFDGMVLDALSLLRSVAVVREVLAARYAWLAVDEYQDLGGPLHAIVECLAAAGTKIFAVGDPDQTLYGFTGADPRYLQRLLDDDAFHEVRLRFNYRAGSRLIAASQAALAPERDRDYRADPERKDPGDIDIRLVEGGLVAQARVVAREIIPALTARDIPEHEIAVLYPSAGPIYDALSQELQSADLPVLAERDSPYPSALAVRLLQQIAHRGLEGAGPDVSSFGNLLRTYRRYAREANAVFDASDELRLRVALFDACADTTDPERRLHDWLRAALKRLALREMLERSGDRPDEIEALEDLLSLAGDDELRVIDFALGVKVRGRVPLTTYHAARVGSLTS